MNAELTTSLLRAALGDGEDAVGSWRAWHKQIDVETLDSDSARLLPLLARNLEKCGVTSPLLSRYRSMARHMWVANERALARAALVLRELDALQIPVLVVSGAALLVSVYPEAGTRPLDEVELMVSEAHRARVLSTLEASACQRNASDGQLPRSFGESLLQISSQTFHVTGGIPLRVLWHSGAVEWWERATPLDFKGMKCDTLGVEDAFLWACLRGSAGSDSSALVWLVDAVLLLRSTTCFDWSRVEQQTRCYGLICPIRASLHALRELRLDSVPDAQWRAFQAMPSSRAQRREWNTLALPVCNRSLALRLWLRARAFGRWNRGRPFWRTLSALSSYMCALWNVDSPRQLVASTAQVLWKSIFPRTPKR